MGWRVARSLEVLRDQINAAYPQRNKASDGTIGDAAHAASVSDHNPDGGGVVRALDITHDPAHGCDIDRLTDELAASRDPRISYLIANRLIIGPNYGWAWAPYTGSDPHTNHFHLSVVADGRADDTRPWQIGAGAPVGGAMAGLADPDPYGAMPDGRTYTVAAEIRNGVAELIFGTNPAGTQPAGVIGRLDRIETAVEALATPQISLTDAQVASIGAEVASIGAEAATVLGARVDDLEAKVDRVLTAIAAAGQVAQGTGTLE